MRSRDVVIKPNTLTLLRILLAFFCPPLLINSSMVSRIAGFFVFLFAGLTDLWDGYLARKTDRVTATGKILDPIADKVLNLGTMFTYVYLGIYPFWVVLPILVREVLITAIRFRCLARKEVIAAELAGKVKAGFQYLSIGISYLYLMAREYQPKAFYCPILFIANYLFMGIAIVITIYSGFRFFSDKNRISSLSEAIATCFYVGYLPKMPGTFGTLAGLLLYGVLPQSYRGYLLTLIVVMALAVWSSDAHSKAVGAKDPTQIVIDEVTGILVAFVGIRATWQLVILGFLLFRVFDILKPPPLRAIEKFKGGWGIVLDDVGAGIYTNLILHLISFVAK